MLCQRILLALGEVSRGCDTSSSHLGDRPSLAKKHTSKQLEATREHRCYNFPSLDQNSHEVSPAPKPLAMTTKKAAANCLLAFIKVDAPMAPRNMEKL